MTALIPMVVVGAVDREVAEAEAEAEAEAVAVAVAVAEVYLALASSQSSHLTIDLRKAKLFD